MSVYNLVYYFNTPHKTIMFVFFFSIPYYHIIFCFGILCFDCIKISTIPGMYSITTIIGCRWAAIPINFTMFGWSYCLRRIPSWRSFLCWSSGNCLWHVFTATIAPVGVYRALCTTPKEPFLNLSRNGNWCRRISTLQTIIEY